ncbi:hypothetical protein DFH29DRAFT_882653 [Suillus ampliporus]|nr:hypothetical protein DFH29DRAFT_882653 [Suillus ampliporus]
MNQEETTELLDFWYNQQENCRDVTFEFYGWWSKSDKEVKPPVRMQKEAKPEDGRGKRNPGGKGRTGTSSRRKSVVRAVDPSESSNDKDRHTARTAKPANVPVAKKPKGVRVGKPYRSKSRVDSEDSGDEFNLSDESSDDHLSSPKMGKEPIKHKAWRNGKKDPPPKTRNVLEVTSNEDHVGESHSVKKTQPSAELVATSNCSGSCEHGKGD